MTDTCSQTVGTSMAAYLIPEADIRQYGCEVY
jgi:hypothetical protein